MLDLKNVAIVETGVRDGLGDRLTGFDRVAGQTLQILRVRPELAAFGATLDEVVARFTERSDRHVLNARGVVRDGAKARPLVVFEHIEGERFDDILARAHALSVIPDITVALFLANHLLTALAALARTTQAAHGALSLNRILVTPRGRLVITEHVFGPLLEQLAFSHTRLWRELHVAMPEEPVPALCDYRADVAQVAVITLSLILGRPLEEHEYPDRLEDLLGEVREVAWIRAGDVLANAVGSWLDLALPLPGRLIFDEASQAKEALGSMLPADQNFVGSRADLHAFLKQIAEAEASGEAELTTGTDSPPAFEVISASGETILVTSADDQDEQLNESDDAGEDGLLEVDVQGDGPFDEDLVVEAAEPQQSPEEEAVIELSTDLLDELKSFGIVLPSAQAVETASEPAPEEAPPQSGGGAAPATTVAAAGRESAPAGHETPAFEQSPAEAPVAFDEPQPVEAIAEEPVAEVGWTPESHLPIAEPPAAVPFQVAGVPAPEAIAAEPAATADQPATIEAPTAEATMPPEHLVVAVGQEAWFDLDTPVEAPVDEALPVAGLAADAPLSIDAWKTEAPPPLPAIVVETGDGWFDLDTPVEAPIGPPLPLVADLPVTEEPRFERDSVAEKAARDKVAAEAQNALAPAAAAPPDETPGEPPAAEATVPEVPQTALLQDLAADIVAANATDLQEPPQALAADVPDEEPIAAREESSTLSEAAAQEIVAGPAEMYSLDSVSDADAPAAETVPGPETPAVEPAAEALTELIEPEFELFASADESHPHANLEAWFELEPPLPAPDEASLFDAYTPPEAPAVPASTERLFAIDLASETPVVEAVEPLEPAQAEPVPSPGLTTFDAGPASEASAAAESTPPLAPVAAFGVAPDTQSIESATLEPAVFDAVQQPEEPTLESPALEEAEPEEAEPEAKSGAFASFLADVKALISKIKGPEGEEAEPVDGDRLEWDQRAPGEAQGPEAAHAPEAMEFEAPVSQAAVEPEPPERVPTDAFAVTVPIGDLLSDVVLETGDEPDSFEATPPAEEPAADVAAGPELRREPLWIAAAVEPTTGQTAARSTSVVEPDTEPAPASVTRPAEAAAAADSPAAPVPAEGERDPLVDAVAALEEAVARTAAPPAQPAPPTLERSTPPRAEPPALPVRESAPAVVEAAKTAPGATSEIPTESEPAQAAAPEKKRSRRSRHRKRKKTGARPDAVPATPPAGASPVPPVPDLAPPAPAPAPAVPMAAAAAPARTATPPATTARPAVQAPAAATTRPVVEPPAARSSLIADPEATVMRQWMVSGDEPPAVPAPQQKSLNIATPGTAPPPRQSLISDADATIIRDWTATEGDASEAPGAQPHQPFGAQPPGRLAPPTLRPIAPPAHASPASVSPPTLPTVPIRPDLSAERTAAARARDSAEDVALKARVRALIDNELKAEPQPVAAPPLPAGQPRVDKPSRWTWMRIAAALVVLVGGAVAGGSQLLGPRVRPGTVIIESTPPESEVFLDGARSGQTPLTLKVSPGEHSLELRYDGHRQAITLSIEPGDEITQSFDWATLTPIGALEVTSDPAGARVLIDGKDAGVTPLKLDGLKLGEHNVTVENGSGSVTSPVHITENETAKLDVPIFSGWLAVFAPVELQILEKGRLLGTTADSRIMVRPGVHRIELKNEAFNYRALETVEVKPGEVKALSYEPKGRVNLNAEPWAEVSVDGKPVGETPLANVLVTIGTREFVFRHPQLGERRVTAVVTLGATKLVNVDMTAR
jgi:hypothetical protein